VVNADSEMISNRIAAEGFNFLATDMEAGIENPKCWLPRVMADLIIVDSKDVGGSYIEQCKGYSPIACFDDEIARNFPCDVVINNHIWGSKYEYKLPPGALLLAGPKYNTVDAAYFEIQREKRCGVLITLGGEDPSNHTEWLIETLSEELAGLPAHVCIGPAHPSPRSVLRACERAIPAAVIYQSPTNLIAPVSKCHIAFSAGGTTCYELAAAGVAMAIIAVEEHQRRMQQSFVSHGAALSLGDGNKGDRSAAVAMFRKLTDAGNVDCLMEAGNKLMSRSGADAIAENLIEVAKKFAVSI
jgi:spore coat polysaccharide biosynthesis predicted glycosyltransferase SpsG